MDILHRIDFLRSERGWSVYKLSNEAGITQSTLANMFSRGTLPSISTLTDICAALGITLSEFFHEEGEATKLTAEELNLVQNYRKLSPKNKQAVEMLIENLKN